MKICLDCKDVIADDEIKYRNSFPAHTVAHCPLCDSIEIVAAEKCSICGNWFDAEDLRAGACNRCFANTVRSFRDVCTAHFNHAEGKIINQAFDGEYLFAEIEE